MFDQAVATIRRAPYEELNSDFQQTHEEFKALEKAIEEKFGDVAPDLSACRNALNEINQEISAILEKKRLGRTIRSRRRRTTAGRPPGLADKVSPAFAFSLPEMSGSTGGVAGSWNEAETLVRSGQVEKGLARDDPPGRQQRPAAATVFNASSCWPRSASPASASASPGRFWRNWPSRSTSSSWSSGNHRN